MINCPLKTRGKVPVVIYNRQRNKELVINKLNSTFYCELQMCTLSKTSEKLENIAGYNTFLHSINTS